MNRDREIRLTETSIKHVPLNAFVNDFTFIVNGKKYQTNHLISDLLSPKISQMHLNDPTFDTYFIKTRASGDFLRILNLANFQNEKIKNDELEFINEIIEILGNDSFELSLYEDLEEITQDEVVNNLKIHEQYSFIYKNVISKEIDFISLNFYKLFESKQSEILELSFPTIERIINNEKLRIIDEDQLMTFINLLCEKEPENSYLYEYVDFCNLSNEKMRDFTEHFDPYYLNHKIWNQLTQSLQNVNLNTKILPNKRYIYSSILFTKKEKNEFSGIINFLHDKFKNQIDNEFKIISSECYNEQHIAKYSISYDDPEKWFASQHIEKSYLCFDFVDNRVIPTEYEIRSYPIKKYSPRSWVIEGSIDESHWDLIDYEIDCPDLNEAKARKVFKVKNTNGHKFRYIRMRLIGKNWGNSTSLELNSFEIYGALFLKPKCSNECEY